MAAEAAFDSFYREHWGRLVGSLMLDGADRPTSEEIAQEAFVRAYGHWHRVQKMDSPQGWLWVTAMNLLRRSHRRHRTSFESNADLHDVTANVDDRLALVTAIRRLPADQRSAVVLRHVLGLNTEEAAASMSRTQGALRILLHRAMTQLRTDHAHLVAEVEP